MTTKPIVARNGAAHLHDMDSPAPAERKKRRTQAERSATTRTALRQAAVECLFEHGYSATTTTMVATKAKVSRGAMLHQFPSKADLMAFVVEAGYEEDVSLYQYLLAGVDEPAGRLIAYPAAAWRILSRPSGVAVLEIIQGSRSDPELRERMAPVQARIEADARRVLRREFNGALSVPLLSLIVGLARGLSVMQVLSTDGDDIEEAVRLLQRLLHAGIDRGLLPVAPLDRARSPS